MEPPVRPPTRYFLVVDRDGNVMFGDHRDSQMRGLTLASAQRFSKENFGEKISGARGPGGLSFVIKQFGRLIMMCVTRDSEQRQSYSLHDGPAEDMLSSSILLLFHDALQLMFGSSALSARHFGISGPFRRRQSEVQALLNTAAYLCESRQSYLVRSVETLEVNGDIRQAYIKELKRSLSLIPRAAHGMIVVGTRLLAVVKQPRAFDVLSTEFVLLTTFCYSLFHPVVEPEKIGRATGEGPDIGSDDEADAEEASDDGAGGDEPDATAAFGEDQLDLLVDVTTEFSDSELDADADADAALKRMRMFFPSGSEPAAPFTPKQKMELLYLRNQPAWVHFSQLDHDISLIIVFERSSVPSKAEQDNQREQCEMQRTRLHTVLRDSFSFIMTKDEAHFSLLVMPYIYMHPGLVHFLVVDRMKNRVFAPGIHALHGRQTPESTPLTESMKELLRRRVWMCVQRGQLALSQGFVSGLWKDGEYQTTYRLWLEDENNVEVPIERPLAPLFASSSLSHTPPPFSQAIYESIARYLMPQPTTHRNIKMFEFYAVYMSVVPVEAMNSCEAALIAAMRVFRS